MAHFVKSHGLGNDYLVIDPRKVPFELTPEAVLLICRRTTGVGSDGILAVVPSTTSDFGLRIFNPDGSEAEKSGNGVRIFAKFLREHGYAQENGFSIETRGGTVRVQLESEDGRVSEVVAEMGRAVVRGPSSIELDGRRIEVIAVSMGNPHCVVIVPDLSVIDVQALGPNIERHEAFPARTNVQFAQVMSRTEIRILIWERGAGYTMSSDRAAARSSQPAIARVSSIARSP